MTYDPQTDSRSCDLSRGDVQCESVTPNDTGYLHCAFKKGHSGDHHTSYIDTVDSKENRKWFRLDD